MNECLHCGSPVKNKFCNVSCQNYYQKKGIKLSEESIQKRSETNSKKWSIFEVSCYECNQKIGIKERNTDSPKKERYFCSRSCANKYSSNVDKENRKSKISLSMKNNPKVIEAAKKAGAATRKERIDIECLYCKENISTLDKNRKYHSHCWKKISGGIKRGSSRGKSGWYKGYWCDSSYELAYVIYNLDHNIPFDRNTEGFDYFYSEKKRKFYPDFISNQEYVEIKNFRSKETDAKIKYFPYKIKVIYKEDIHKEIIPYVTRKYGKDYIKLYEIRSTGEGCRPVTACEEGSIPSISAK